jgi:hypothetical protein
MWFKKKEKQIPTPSNYKVESIDENGFATMSNNGEIMKTKILLFPDGKEILKKAYKKIKDDNESNRTI